MGPQCGSQYLKLRLKGKRFFFLSALCRSFYHLVHQNSSHWYPFVVGQSAATWSTSDQISQHKIPNYDPDCLFLSLLVEKSLLACPVSYLLTKNPSCKLLKFAWLSSMFRQCLHILHASSSRPPVSDRWLRSETFRKESVASFCVVATNSKEVLDVFKSVVPFYTRVMLCPLCSAYILITLSCACANCCPDVHCPPSLSV